MTQITQIKVVTFLQDAIDYLLKQQQPTIPGSMVWVDLEMSINTLFYAGLLVGEDELYDPTN